MANVSTLSVEDRQILHYIKYRPSTQTELETEFDHFDRKTMRGRLIRFERNKLIFSAKIVMPRSRLPKINPTGTNQRKVYFVVPNPTIDPFTKVPTTTLLELVKASVENLGQSDPDTEAHLLIQLDTILPVLYTRYVHENIRSREE
jgi:hypothetical protein